MSIRGNSLFALLLLASLPTRADIVDSTAFTSAQAQALLAHAIGIWGDSIVEATGSSAEYDGNFNFSGSVYFEPNRFRSGICRSERVDFFVRTKEMQPTWVGNGQRVGATTWLAEGRRCRGKPSEAVFLGNAIDDVALLEVLTRRDELATEAREWLRRHEPGQLDRVDAPPFRLASIAVGADTLTGDGDYRITCMFEGRRGAPLEVALERRGAKLEVRSAGPGPIP